MDFDGQTALLHFIIGASLALIATEVVIFIEKTLKQKWKR